VDLLVVAPPKLTHQRKMRHVGIVDVTLRDLVRGCPDPSVHPSVQVFQH
jgi:hypothetical protein